MNTDFEKDMPQEIYDTWNGYTRKARNFLLYIMSEQLDKEQAYISAGFSKAGAKNNAYKLLKKLQVVYEWLQYWQAHEASRQGVISKHDMLVRYSKEFNDLETSNGDLVKLGKEIATMLVYYPGDKQDMTKKELEIQEIVDTKDLPLELRKQMAEAVRKARKEQEKLGVGRE